MYKKKSKSKRFLAAVLSAAVIVGSIPTYSLGIVHAQEMPVVSAESAALTQGITPVKTYVQGGG